MLHAGVKRNERGIAMCENEGKKWSMKYEWSNSHSAPLNSTRKRAFQKQPRRPYRFESSSLSILLNMRVDAGWRRVRRGPASRESGSKVRSDR